ncbi:LytR C-terminal domain-containing protein [Amycolatopsis sp.]|uniref:LytR C-terminal domain-containing protein n=1 Tax=Amycolatopsis sp. TaxID=37632 RepID=UPI002C2DDCAC|nr:LytR C-terminal domain-containing protein [Amycolatopsis sp.]HVV12034.1 LytR C-terminal domain-containing protein [Amycolatopsis sp.]
MTAPLGYAALDQVTPAPPERVRVHVLNGTSRPMQPAGIAAELRSRDSVRRLCPATTHCTRPERCLRRSDPVVPRAARRLSFLVPCAELVRDDRSDTSVDLALGGRFSHLAPTSAGHAMLDQLSAWARDGDGRQTDDSERPGSRRRCSRARTPASPGIAR